MVRIVVGFMLAIGLFVPAVSGQLADEARGTKNMVATVHPLATQAALDAFAAGGNAMDAAAAAALTLGVVDSFNSGLGGGCFILIRTADGEFHAIDGREMAPAAATRDMFLRDGQPEGSLSQHGPLALGIPGSLAALESGVREFGNREFRDLVLPAAQLARNGFPVNAALARELHDNADNLRRFGGAVGSLLKADGSPYAAGEIMQQSDLASTYQSIADEGIEWFYGGPFAERAEQWFSENGGIVTRQDFVNYRTARREPIQSQYRGYTIVGFPPPSSGGTHVAQILNILEHFDLATMYREDPPQAMHVIGEAMKLAFADRAYWLGDPDFADVPTGLVSREYAAFLAAKIDANRTTKVAEHGNPLDFDPGYFRKHTTHIATADADGNWVAMTATVNTSFGSKVVVPGTGLVWNNQMDDFSISPGTPNAFGLVGAEANAVAPGKRPLSSMSPTIVLRDGQPVLLVGAAGGPTIISQVVMAIVRRIDFQMSLGDAVGSPRIHHQWAPNVLMVEASAGPELIKVLKMYGHRIRERASMGVTQAIAFEPDTGTFIGVADPRAYGVAAGK